jgi:hypothetical protein
MQLPDDFVEGLLSEIEKGKEAYATAKSQCAAADKKITIARAIVTEIFLRQGKTHQVASTLATAHADYQKSVDIYERAVAEEVRTEWNLKILEMRFAAWRTLTANRRANL